MTDLIERVRGLTGADRAVDAEIYNLLVDDGGRVAFKVQNYATLPGIRLDRWHDGWLVGKNSGDQYADDLPRYTASVDAAIALAERCLPDFDWGRDECGYMQLYHEGSDAVVDAKGATPAIALVLAILAALQQ